MQVDQMHVVTTTAPNEEKVTTMLLRCPGKKRGFRWFQLTAGAYGTKDMKLSPIGPKKVEALLEADES